MAKNYDYFNVNKARKNLQDKKDAIYNHFNISHKIPEKLYIECTNLCNARCSFCYYKNKADAGFPKKFMSVDNFKKIIEQYTSIGGKHIALTPTLADPLTDPFFKNRLEYLDSSKIKTLDFYTNLISFGPKIQQAISNYKGSLSISVSFTGFNKSMYEQFMGVDKFNIVMENIGKLATTMKGKKNLRYHIIMRSYNNDKKEKNDFALPSTPVEVLGLNGTPEAGDVLNVLPSEAKAREISVYREQNLKNKKSTIGMGSSLDPVSYTHLTLPTKA